jgi:hypothetical protein
MLQSTWTSIDMPASRVLITPSTWIGASAGATAATIP